MNRISKSSMVLAVAGGIAAAGGLYTWFRLRQFAPTRPEDAKEAAQLMLQGGQKVLAFTAHPDDLELFAGGVLRKLYQLGNPITVVVGSTGERSRPGQDLESRRKTEQRKAGSILGYDEIKFLNLPDGTLRNSDELHKQIHRIFNQERPHMVFTFDHVHIHPWIFHQDHVAMGEAVVHTANEQDSDAAVYLYGSAKPTVVVDIGGVVRQKIWAVSSHQSQFPVLRRQGAETLVRRLASITARGTGYRYAEAFRSLHNLHTFVPPRMKTSPQKSQGRPANPPQ